jgi:hypothetical protein
LAGIELLLEMTKTHLQFRDLMAKPSLPGGLIALPGHPRLSAGPVSEMDLDAPVGTPAQDLHLYGLARGSGGDHMGELFGFGNRIAVEAGQKIAH